MTRLFIAEKPNMGKDIAAFLAVKHGVNAVNQRTHVVVGPDTVTWCVGHLLHLADLSAYDKKFERWNFEDLPYFPNPWKMEVSDTKKGQVAAIKALLKTAKEVVHAGDPGREGQLIVDELLLFLGNRLPVKRIHLSSLDHQSIDTALNNLTPNDSHVPLLVAGQARSHADFSMGINLTRGFSVLGRKAGMEGGKPLSIGRVQTPALSIVVRRDLAIESFKPKDFWVPYGTFKVADGTFKAKWIPTKDSTYTFLDEANRIVDQAAAGALLSKVHNKAGAISFFEEKPKSIEAPLPFSLASIQILANNKFGLTASETLQVCQDLYEAKLTSYPRTDCSHLPTNLLVEAPDVLQAISSNLQHLSGLVPLADSRRQSKAWNNSKVGEHYGIIPTRLAAPQSLAGLGQNHQQVYDAIARRYMSQFFTSCDVMVTTVDAVVEDETFHATGQKQVHPGWKVVYGGKDETPAEDAAALLEDAQQFPSIILGETATCISNELKSSKTTPPSRYTDATFIGMMADVAQMVDDETMKKQLAEKGIGTPATRANILDTLVDRGFVKRNKKQLVSTELGRALVGSLPSKVSDPVLTAMWEHAFDGIAKSTDAQQARVRYQTFMDKLQSWVRQLIEQAPSTDFSKLIAAAPARNVASLQGHGVTCPKCKVGTMLTREVKAGKAKGKTFLGCSNYPTCTHSEWPQ